MPSSYLILCRPLFLLPPIRPSIRVFSNESTLRMRWPKYWSFSFSIIPSKEHPGLISSHAQLFATPWTAAHQAPLSMGFSRQGYWSGLPFPSLMHESEVAQSCPTLCDPMDCSPPGSSVHGISQARILEWVAISYSRVSSFPGIKA